MSYTWCSIVQNGNSEKQDKSINLIFFYKRGTIELTMGIFYLACTSTLYAKMIEIRERSPTRQVLLIPVTSSTIFLYIFGKKCLMIRNFFLESNYYINRTDQ